jgi:hypothetical protein
MSTRYVGANRTCSYCVKEFKTVEKFNEHFRQCPVRIKHGYIQKPLRKLAGYQREGER